MDGIRFCRHSNGLRVSDSSPLEAETPQSRLRQPIVMGCFNAATVADAPALKRCPRRVVLGGGNAITVNCGLHP